MSTRTARLLTRIAISASVFVVFAMHVAASPRFEIIDRIENYLYDVRVRMTMPGIVDVLFDEYGIRTLGFVFRDSVAAGYTGTLNNDERYRPALFAAILATVAEPEEKPANIDDERND